MFWFPFRCRKDGYKFSQILQYWTEEFSAFDVNLKRIENQRIMIEESSGRNMLFETNPS